MFAHINKHILGYMYIGIYVCIYIRTGRSNARAFDPSGERRKAESQHEVEIRRK